MSIAISNNIYSETLSQQFGPSVGLLCGVVTARMQHEAVFLQASPKLTKSSSADLGPQPQAT